MDKQDIQIEEALLTFMDIPFPIVSGKCKSVDEEKATMTVDVNGIEKDLENVMLNALKDEVNGIVVIPEVDSDVIIGSADGSGDWFLLQAHKIKKIIVKSKDIEVEADNVKLKCKKANVEATEEIKVKCNKVVFNDGNNGGLTITPELKTQLEKNNAILQAWLTILGGAPVPEPGMGAPSALQTALNTAVAGLSLADFANIENSEIKH